MNKIFDKIKISFTRAQYNIFQKLLEKYQTAIFLSFNLFLFQVFTIVFVFSPVIVLIGFSCWFNLFFLMYFLKVFNVPIYKAGVITFFGVNCVQWFIAYNWILVFVALYFVFLLILFLLNSSSCVKLQEILNSSIVWDGVVENHMDTGFFLFSVTSLQCVFLNTFFLTLYSLSPTFVCNSFAELDDSLKSLIFLLIFICLFSYMMTLILELIISQFFNTE